VTGIVDHLLNLHGALVFVIVGLVVFAECALFVGFVLPGDTVALLGGVIASRGNVSYPLMALTVVFAAILGDTVGYLVGRHLGPRFLSMKLLRRHRSEVDSAQNLLRRRGGPAVLIGRFVGFFRAFMPALAGASRMRYLKFLAFNAAGGIVWGIGVTLLGLLAGRSYKRLENSVGTVAAIVAVVVVITVVILWRVHKQHGRRRRRDEARSTDRQTENVS
jgi:membrane protein DedA with SNARE-associated domain